MRTLIAIVGLAVALEPTRGLAFGRMSPGAPCARWLVLGVLLALVYVTGVRQAAAQTFGDPAALNINAATDSEYDYSSQVTTDGVGNWVAVWYSGDSLGGTIGYDGDILVARSSDAGGIWTAPAALNTNAATDWGDDAHPQVTTDGAGNWVAVWDCEHWLDDEFIIPGDIFVARSSDAGSTWIPPRVAQD